jgi:hypothetical protein
MAAPVVTGAVALMVQANPNLTPNLVKAVLQYTAQEYPDYDPLTQGAGFLNARGAVDLAKYFATAQPGQRYPSARMWSKQIIWGNSRVGGGAISPTANAFRAGMVWGANRAEDGDNIVWGTRCATEDCDNIVWGTFEDGDNIVWGTFEDGDNIVWGTMAEDGFNIVWGTNDWGSAEDADNIVWGTDCGGEDCDNIVWGTSEDVDNIVWGTAEDADAIVWGTSANGEYDIWGTSDEDTADPILFDDPEAPPVEFAPLDFELVFGPEVGITTMETGTIMTIGSEPIELSTVPTEPVAVSGSTGGQL